MQEATCIPEITSERDAGKAKRKSTVERGQCGARVGRRQVFCQRQQERPLGCLASSEKNCGNAWRGSIPLGLRAASAASGQSLGVASGWALGQEDSEGVLAAGCAGNSVPASLEPAGPGFAGVGEC